MKRYMIISISLVVLLAGCSSCYQLFPNTKPRPKAPGRDYGYGLPWVK